MSCYPWHKEIVTKLRVRWVTPSLLVALTEKGLIDIGEAEVTNGVFEFTGRMSETTLAYLMPVQRNAALATIMLENANYTITAGANELIVDRGWQAQRI